MAKAIMQDAAPVHSRFSAPLRLRASVLKRATLMLAAAWLLSRSLAAAELVQTDVFHAGQDGYHTYRIPALVVTQKGTLLAICEGRKTGRGDHGDLDMVLKRSTDGGRSWGPLELIYEEGGTAKVTIGNPCPVVDRTTGMIWLLLNSLLNLSRSALK